MPRRTARAELPLDVRRTRGGAAGTRDAVVVEAVLDALPLPTLLLDAEGTVLLANSAWGAAAEVVDDDRVRVGVGGNYFAMALAVSDDDASREIIDALRSLSRGERATVAYDYALTHPGGTRWYHVQASRVDQAGQIVVTHTDVTDRVTAERTSAWQARHDPLTELPNRAHLHELIDAALNRPERTAVSVLFLDVDGFKEVNDSLGHDVGDDLLRQLTGRLRSRSRAEDTVGRLGGDEFVVLCRDCDVEGAQSLAVRFQDSFAEPFQLGGRPVGLSASIGVATSAPGETPVRRSHDLVRDADLAMYAAKAAGRNRIRVFTHDLRQAAQRRALLAAELREAIETSQLVLHYQPVLHLPTGEVTGMEALVRWRHPERGMVAPADFVPLAEQHELIAPLTRWVLGEATRQTAAWRAQGLPLVTAVNVSAAHLAGGTLVADVSAALAGAGLAPDQLLVELTESTVAQDAERAAAQFARLRVLGVEVSIDDFGSGYSSLGSLVDIPAGMLKIDRSLVAGADDTRSRAAAAIAAVVALGRSCGMRSLAEGVETGAQLALAGELGCTFAQGYHIARPMPAEEVPGWVAGWRARRGTLRYEDSAHRVLRVG
jgi:diguanylate cyclase (GGDEF)-like protein